MSHQGPGGYGGGPPAGGPPGGYGGYGGSWGRGLGCGLFLLLGAGVATAIYLWTKDTINDAVTAASAFCAAVGSEPIVVPGVPAAPGAGAPAGGSGTCERARICCEKILARSGNQN